MHPTTRQRALTAALTAATIALPPSGAAAAVNQAAATTVVPKTKVVTKKVSGPAVEADRWGAVTATVTVRKTTTVANGVTKVTRKVTGIATTFTAHTDRSTYLMQTALSQLRAQALKTVSAKVDIVSGATYTSEAFIGSLQQALLKAKKV